MLINVMKVNSKFISIELGFFGTHFKTTLLNTVVIFFNKVSINTSYHLKVNTFFNEFLRKEGKITVYLGYSS